MHQTMDLHDKAAALKIDGTPFCWATVVKCKGSTPRGVGARMIVTAEASFGTIGGGALEYKVIEDGREALKNLAAQCKSYPLGALLGQCCGGEMEIFFDPVAPLRPMYVFGAGHIAEKLVPMLAELGFCITLCDERPERIGLASFAQVSEKWNELPSDVFRRIRFGPDTHIIVITHEHRHDEEIIRFCLDKEFRYLGCIGSSTKWEKLRARFRSQGLTDEQLARVNIPIGLDIGAESPFEIAVSIVAQLIKLHA